MVGGFFRERAMCWLRLPILSQGMLSYPSGTGCSLVFCRWVWHGVLDEALASMTRNRPSITSAGRLALASDKVGRADRSATQCYSRLSWLVRPFLISRKLVPPAN